MIKFEFKIKKHRELYSVFWDNLYGKIIWKRAMHVYV